MKLVFYSGGDSRENRSLDDELINLINKKDPLFSFIPASSYLSEHDFKDFVDQYRKLGVRRFIHFPIDVPFDRILIKEVFKSDHIHLGGGNTFYFLKHLRSQKLLPLLKDFVNRGGVLSGLSAGAIMMTPDITTAGYPSFDCDENYDNLKNLNALNLVEMDFFPHYKNSNRYDVEFRKLSKITGRGLLACPDGSGMVINGDKITYIGQCWLFYKGRKVFLDPRG